MNQPTINERLDHDEGIAIEQLEATLQASFNGRVRDLRVVECGEGLILVGRATTFYVKQLAQHALLNATARPLLANEILVLEKSVSPPGFTR